MKTKFKVGQRYSFIVKGISEPKPIIYINHRLVKIERESIYGTMLEFEGPISGFVELKEDGYIFKILKGKLLESLYGK